MPLDIRKPRSRPKPVTVVNQTDFTGGLNLNSDVFKLADNESPDMVNVDVDARGGFQLRRGVQYLNGTLLPAQARSMFTYGDTHLLVDSNSDVYWSNGGNFTSIITPGFHAFPARGETMNDLLYIQLGTLTPRRWDGAAVTALTPSSPTWQNDYAAPTGGFMPAANFICQHGGFMWVAATLENGVAYANRVRWSHPGRPEDWRLNDYIDIDIGNDKDFITAIVPFEDHLLVFKKKAVYAITGYDANSFQVVTISRDIGANSQDSVVSTPIGVFFWDRDGGVYVWRGKGTPEWVFEPIFPLIRSGQLVKSFVSPILGWVNNRLWVSLNSPTNMTYVYDPTVGKNGAWTRYSMLATSYCRALGGRNFMGLAALGRVVEVDMNSGYDDIGGGHVHIDAYYRTKWFDGHQPAQKKRWRRMEAAIQGGATEYLPVKLFVNYDGQATKKQFQISLDVVGGPLTWGTSQWGNSSWLKDGVYDILRKGTTFGLANSVALEFHGPPTAMLPWGVDSLTLKYKGRPIR